MDPMNVTELQRSSLCQVIRLPRGNLQLSGKVARTICLFVQKNPIGFNRTYSHSSVWNGIVLDPAYIGKKGGFRIKAQDMLAGNNPALMIHEKL